MYYIYLSNDILSLHRMKKSIVYFLIIFISEISSAQTVKILFDATKAESASNADWVIDEDLNNMTWNPNATVGSGSEGNAQRYPTPAQSNITSSTVETYWKGALSSWGIDCVKRGYAVETLPYNGLITYGNSSNAQDLSNYKVYVVCEPNILFTTSEKTAIINFVQNGGSLFMVSDHISSDRNNDTYDSPKIWNDLLTNNGIQYNPFGILFDSLSISPNSTNIPTLPNDSILNGPMGNVSQVLWSSGTSMTINPSINTSVKGVVYIPGASFGNTGVLAAYARYGKGKVAAIGDSSPCDDGTGDTGDNLYYGWTTDASGNHERLIMNATIWLAIKDSVITIPTIKDLVLDSIISPFSLQKGNNTVIARIKNNGNTNIDTAIVYYKFDSSSIVNFSLTSMHIAPNSSYNYTFNTPLQALNDGNHQLCVWIKTSGDNNNSNDTLCKSYILNTTGIFESTFLNQITLYPNPSNQNVLIISSQNEEIKSVMITDINGKQINYLTQLSKQNVEIITSNLEAGIYFISIQTNDAVVIKKIVKQ